MSKRKMSAAEARRNDEKKEEGREAFEKGDPVESCPYQSAFNSDRWAWIWGWQEKERIKKDKEDADAWFLAEAGRRGFVPNPAPTPEAADTAPAGQPTEEELERMAAMAVEDGIAIDRLTRYAPAPASPGEAPADLREAVAIQLAEFWTSARCGKWKWKDFDFDDRHAFYKDADKILALVRPQAPKAAPPQPQAQPSEADPIPPEDTDLQFRLVRALLINAWECAWSKHPGTALIRAALKTMLPNGFALADARALGEVRDADLAAQPANPQIAGGQL